MHPRLALAVRLLGSSLAIPLGWLFATLAAAGFTLTALRPSEDSSIGVPHWYIAGTLLVAGALGSLLLHELGHAAVARRLGHDPGRLALYPFGGARAGFNDPGTPRQNTLVALAGPLTSLSLGLMLALLWWVLPAEPVLLRRDVGYLAVVNVALAGINLLPGYPLDGGQVFRALVWYLHDDYTIGTRAAVVYGQLIAFMAFAGGLALLSSGRDLAVWGLWLILVGWAMSRTAREEMARTFFVVAGAEISAGEIVAGINPRVDAGQSIDAALDVLLAQEPSGPALVEEGGQTVGILPLDRLRRFRRAEWPHRTVSEAMIPLAGLPRLEDDTSVRDVLDWLFEVDAGVVLVTHGGEVVGAIDRRLAVTRLLDRARARKRLVHR